MNKERIQQLIDYLEQLPDERFDYGNFFSNGKEVSITNSDDPFNESCYDNIVASAKNNCRPIECGTAACVAGHTCLLFWNEAKYEIAKATPISYIAKNILEIDHVVERQLFYFQCETATKINAINRLKHLLKHNSLYDYDFVDEGNA